MHSQCCPGGSMATLGAQRWGRRARRCGPGDETKNKKSSSSPSQVVPRAAPLATHLVAHVHEQQLHVLRLTLQRLHVLVVLGLELVLDLGNQPVLQFQKTRPRQQLTTSACCATATQAPSGPLVSDPVSERALSDTHMVQDGAQGAILFSKRTQKQ